METNTKIALAAVAVAVVVIAAILIARVTIQSSGRIVTFGVSASVDAIDWGALAPSESVQVGFTVTNTGGKAGTLNLTTAGLPEYLLLDWDSEGAELQPQQGRYVTLTLTAQPIATPQDFAFDIIITMTGG